MQVEFKTEDLEACMCGFKPDHYTVGYGSTPYNLSCKTCKKHTSSARCLVTGSLLNLIDYWNSHIRHLTREEMLSEKVPVGKFYDWYWIAGKGRVKISNLKFKL